MLTRIPNGAKNDDKQPDFQREKNLVWLFPEIKDYIEYPILPSVQLFVDSIRAMQLEMLIRR